MAFLFSLISVVLREKVVLIQCFSVLTLTIRWYKKDENAVPASYILLPVSSHLPAFIKKNDKEAFNEARGRWWEEHDAMQEALISA